jgi:hypothetical protein
MSNMVYLKTQIKNLESLKKACEENQIAFDEKDMLLRDLVPGGPTYSRTAHVCSQGDYYVIQGDTDKRYSSLAARLGPNYDTLMQSYAKHEVLNNVILSGGMLTDQIQKEDGSLVLRVSI